MDGLIYVLKIILFFSRDYSMFKVLICVSENTVSEKFSIPKFLSIQYALKKV